MTSICCCLQGEDSIDGSTAIMDYNPEQFEGLDCKDLVDQLKDTVSLHEQADIIHYLYITMWVHLTMEFSIIRVEWVKE